MLSSQAQDSLEHYSSVRNTVVHDQGIFELHLDENGNVASRQKTCPRHPSPITEDDVGKAHDGYREVVYAVTKAVFSQVLKADTHPTAMSLLKEGLWF